MLQINQNIPFVDWDWHKVSSIFNLRYQRQLGAQQWLDEYPFHVMWNKRKLASNWSILMWTIDIKLKFIHNSNPTNKNWKHSCIFFNYACQLQHDIHRDQSRYAPTAAQPMRDVITMSRRLSLAGRIPRLIPAFIAALTTQWVTQEGLRSPPNIFSYKTIYV